MPWRRHARYLAYVDAYWPGQYKTEDLPDRVRVCLEFTEQCCRLYRKREACMNIEGLPRLEYDQLVYIFVNMVACKIISIGFIHYKFLTNDDRFFQLARTLALEQFLAAGASLPPHLKRARGVLSIIDEETRSKFYHTGILDDQYRVKVERYEWIQKLSYNDKKRVFNVYHVPISVLDTEPSEREQKLRAWDHHGDHPLKSQQDLDAESTWYTDRYLASPRRPYQ